MKLHKEYAFFTVSYFFNMQTDSELQLNPACDPEPVLRDVPAKYNKNSEAIIIQFIGAVFILIIH